MNASLVTDHPLANGCPPNWASQWGEDEHGPWCSFEVDNASQTLRWIPPGQFRMGSDGDETGRYDREGPQQWVTISRGFWLFDTPCTQPLWQAVTGETPSRFAGSLRLTLLEKYFPAAAGATPSRFAGSLRPVEQVSWNDCQDFLKRLNKLLPGLNLRLPTEAEWEYSCRAGKADTRYGNLDDIAWYGGNSESQTQEVKRKQANDWGLHDMLGNVWEWCEDHAYRRYTTAETDPLYETDEADAFRVVRGGSFTALILRAAYRSAVRPQGRFDDLGFRCLSSSEPSQ